MQTSASRNGAAGIVVVVRRPHCITYAVRACALRTLLCMRQPRHEDYFTWTWTCSHGIQAFSASEPSLDRTRSGTVSEFSASSRTELNAEEVPTLGAHYSVHIGVRSVRLHDGVDARPQDKSRCSMLPSSGMVPVCTVRPLVATDGNLHEGVVRAQPTHL